jgi:hypothetical protein
MKGCLSAIALGLLAAAVGCEQFNEPSDLDDGHGGNPRRGQAAIARMTRAATIASDSRLAAAQRR